MTRAEAKRGLEIKRLRKLARERFIEGTVGLIEIFARENLSITSDDAWAMLGDGIVPEEPRMMGAAFVEAAHRGIIESTDRVEPSNRRACKGRSVRIWRSRVHGI